MSDDRKPITENDVVYVAELANLELTAGERARMVKDLNSILDYVARLNELDTANVEPMAQTSDRYGIDRGKIGTARFAYAMRDDKTGPSLPREVIMENAPESDGTFFKVPKVIEK
ncbi:MAG: Asp-tRNA(Asn)/Glu-tRNA(Gln) amidotransferase subunit GatC [Terriglobales bacterium]